MCCTGSPDIGDFSVYTDVCVFVRACVRVLYIFSGGEWEFNKYSKCQVVAAGQDDS